MLSHDQIKSLMSRLDLGWDRPYRLYIDNELIRQPVLDDSGQPVLDQNGNYLTSNPRIRQLPVEQAVQFAEFRDSTSIYEVRILRSKDLEDSRLISTEFTWELSFDEGLSRQEFQVISIGTSRIEGLAWIVTLGR